MPRVRGKASKKNGELKDVWSGAELFWFEWTRKQTKDVSTVDVWRTPEKNLNEKRKHKKNSNRERNAVGGLAKQGTQQNIETEKKVNGL